MYCCGLPSASSERGFGGRPLAERAEQPPDRDAEKGAGEGDRREQIGTRRAGLRLEYSRCRTPGRILRLRSEIILRPQSGKAL
jgi:hypothetical protein